MKKSTIIIGIGVAGIAAYLLLRKKSPSAASATKSGAKQVSRPPVSVSPVDPIPVEPVVSKADIPLLFEIGSGGAAPVKSPVLEPIQPVWMPPVYPVDPIPVEPVWIEPVLSPAYMSPNYSPYVSAPILDPSFSYNTSYKSTDMYYNDYYNTNLGDRLMINQLV